VLKNDGEISINQGNWLNLKNIMATKIYQKNKIIYFDYTEKVFRYINKLAKRKAEGKVNKQNKPKKTKMSGNKKDNDDNQMT